MNQPASRRIVCIALLLLAIPTMLLFGWGAIDIYFRVERAFEARPMRAEVDLSKPGEVEVPFHQSYTASHGEAIYVEYDPAAGRDAEDSTGLFETLSGSIRIIDAEGRVVEEADISVESDTANDGLVSLARLSIFPEGDYTAALTIDSGVPLLAGSTQTLFAKYELCGIERMPGHIGVALVFIAGIVAVTSANIAFPGFFHRMLNRLGVK